MGGRDVAPSNFFMLFHQRNPFSRIFRIILPIIQYFSSVLGDRDVMFCRTIRLNISWESITMSFVYWRRCEVVLSGLLW